MAKLRYLLEEPYGFLVQKISENINRYAEEKSWLTGYLQENISRKFDADTRITADLPNLDPNLDDVVNVRLLFEAMQHLTVVQAMDKRLWTHLTHIKYWKYMQKRWDSAKSAESIKSRYFFESEGNSRSLIRNGIARLWWFGYLTYDSTNKDNPFMLTETLLEYQDIQAALLERTFGKNRDVLQICLLCLREKMNEIKNSGGRAKAIIQELGKYVNLLGGTYFLDTMDKTMLKEKITAFIERKLQG